MRMENKKILLELISTEYNLDIIKYIANAFNLEIIEIGADIDNKNFIVYDTFSLKISDVKYIDKLIYHIHYILNLINKLDFYKNKTIKVKTFWGYKNEEISERKNEEEIKLMFDELKKEIDKRIIDYNTKCINTKVKDYVENIFSYENLKEK
jgi:hypothetical protein